MTTTCPICLARASLVPLAQLEDSALRPVARDRRTDPAWSRGICRRCVGAYQAARTYLPKELQWSSDERRPILPTPLRLGATTAYTGRGVVMAFLDSGFHAHPDLIRPRRRIRAYWDVTLGRDDHGALRRPDVSSWHGMMTSTVAAGNGYLSDGLYRGLASEAELLLVKVGTVQRIRPEAIASGLDWVVDHLDRHPVRVINISCGGDFEASYLADPLSQAVERAVRAGVVVVCAAGNLGHLPGHPVLPPASSPAAITVGGLDDRNWVDPAGFSAYRGSYGPTIDGLQKPELVAPAIWIAAPILPGTATARAAQLLARLLDASPSRWRALLRRHAGIDPELDRARDADLAQLGALLIAKIRGANVIHRAYKHVDGTSFAAPIVSSLVAQMLEARPQLTPMEVKRCLIRSAVRVPQIEVDRQGWGVVQPADAVLAALDQ
jgi:serine protease AprX